METEDEYEVVPVCEECYRVVGPNDGALCPVCGTPHDCVETDDWRDEADKEELEPNQ